MRRTILLAAAMALLSAAPSGAQPLARADLTGVVGWFSAHQPEASSYDDWYNRSAYGGGVLGWYWTEHLKTELEVGTTSAAELYSVEPMVVEGQQAYVSSRRRFSTRRLTAGQQYQFLRNAWVHPHVGAGLDLTWARQERRFDPIMLFDQASRTTRVVQHPPPAGPSTDTALRAFTEIGAKLYFSPRGFFRTDLRLTFRGSVEEVLLRCGFGVDF